MHSVQLHCVRAVGIARVLFLFSGFLVSQIIPLNSTLISCPEDSATDCSKYRSYGRELRALWQRSKPWNSNTQKGLGAARANP